MEKKKIGLAKTHLGMCTVRLQPILNHFWRFGCHRRILKSLDSNRDLSIFLGDTSMVLINQDEYYFVDFVIPVFTLRPFYAKGDLLPLCIIARMQILLSIKMRRKVSFFLKVAIVSMFVRPSKGIKWELENFLHLNFFFLVLHFWLFQGYLFQGFVESNFSGPFVSRELLNRFVYILNTSSVR